MSFPPPESFPPLAALFLALCLQTPARAQTEPFTFSFVRQTLPSVWSGNVSYADADGDGDLDAFLSGTAGAAVPGAALFRNDGERLDPAAGLTGGPGWRQLFEPAPGGAFRPVTHSAAAWGDYDADGDLDLVLTGSTTADAPYAPLTRLYRNDGELRFSEVDAGLADVYGGAVAWGDYDNDGDPDLLVSGVSTGGHVSRLYRNDRDGSFTDVEADLTSSAFGAAAWGDYDGDLDLDLLLLGDTGFGGFLTRLYRNDGGRFAVADAALPGLAFGSAAWGDYDADGDLDLLLTGGRIGPDILEGVSAVYRNRNGSFQDAGLGLTGVLSGAGTWGDYDNDGDLDLLIAGTDRVYGRRLAEVHENAGDGSFRPSINLAGLLFGSAAFGDHNGDLSLDLVSAGIPPDRNPRGGIGAPVTILYRNDARALNTPPAPPEDLQAAVEAGVVSLEWSAASDGQTAAPALTYNLRVGSAPGGADRMPPHAELATGRRALAAPGNAGLATGWTLRGLPDGTYYWSVQAVDAAFAGSPFAAEGSFTVTGAPNSGTATPSAQEEPARALALEPNFPNPFRGRTLLRFHLPAAGRVRLTLYNALGVAVHTLLDAERGAGTHSVEWDGRDDLRRPLAAGVYLCRLETASGVRMRTLMLLN